MSAYVESDAAEAVVDLLDRLLHKDLAFWPCKQITKVKPNRTCADSGLTLRKICGEFVKIPIGALKWLLITKNPINKSTVDDNCFQEAIEE